MVRPADCNVVLICGGLGTRLRTLFSDQQKAIVDVAGKPFLQWLIAFYQKNGFTQFIFCTGHHAEQVKESISSLLPPEAYHISTEIKTLGTAGAVRNALGFISSEQVIVANGDSFCDVDLPAFIRFHSSHADAQISIVVTDPDPSRTDMGTVIVDPTTSTITGFIEKEESAVRGLRNAGIYILERAVLSRMLPEQHVSFEEELFPRMVGQGLYAFKTAQKVWDIGTPERYHKAQAFFQAQHSSLS